MSTTRIEKIPGIGEAPYVGALLRLAHQEVRSYLLKALTERGMDDFNEAYFSLFQFPPIDGMRPSALAKRLEVSKQALNHLLGQLEKLGYLERHREDEGGATTVHLTDRGWLVVETNVAAIRQLEAQWQQQLGKKRFADLKASLRELTTAS
jgi:DNA-binding MarR family transcriptional regulator